MSSSLTPQLVVFNKSLNNSRSLSVSVNESLSSWTFEWSNSSECDIFGHRHCNFSPWLAAALAVVSALVCVSNTKTAALLLAVLLRRRATQQSMGSNGPAAMIHTADLFCFLFTALNALFGALHLCK